MMYKKKLTILIYFYSQTLLASYGQVYNEGLSKMEMIEKIDQYLSNDLSKKMTEISSKIAALEAKNQSNYNDILKKIQLIEKKLEDIESKALAEKASPASKDKEQMEYLKDLKSVIIPAIQEKLLSNEKEMVEFIKQSKEIFKTNEKIRDGLDQTNDAKGDK